MSVLLSRSAAKWALSTARSQSLVCPPCRLLSVSSSSSGPTSSSGTNTLSTAASSSPIAPAMGPALPSASSSTATPQTIATSSTQPSTSTPPPRPSSSSTRPPRSATLARACAGSLATPPGAAGGALAANPVWKPPADWSFYRRELPPDLVPFSSAEGRRYFAEALADGTMECYFPLAEQFMTQSEPAYCAITSLTMCLNAFGVDPGKNWKRPWRWYSEDLLECCTPMSTIRDEGLTFRQFSSLARCHGILSQDFSADKASLAHFRALLLEVATRTSTVNPALASAPHGDPSRGGLSAALVVSFSRKSLGQTGDGHMSPIAGYHAGSDSVLVLDVARFKYPSFWVSVPRLWASMLPPDRLTGRSRGYCLLSPIPRGAGARAAAAAAAADTAAAAAAAGAAARGAASGDAARVIALSTPPSPVAVAGGGAEGAWSQGGGAWSGLPPAASSPASASGSASASASASAVAAADAAGPGYDAAAAIAAARSGIAYVPPSTAGGSDRFSLGGCGSTSCGCAEDPSAAPLPDEGALTFSTPVSAVSEVSQGSDKLSRGDTRGDTQQRSSRSTPATPSSRLSVIRAAAAAFLGRSPLSAPRIETEPREASPLPAEGSRLPLAAADAAAAAASSFLQRARAHVRRRTADRPPSSSSDAPADPPAPSSPAAPSGASAGAASGSNMGAVDGLPPSSRLRFCCPSTRAASAALASARLAFAAASPADAVPPAEGVPISGADLKLSRYPPNRVQPSAPVPAVAPAAAALALAPIARAPMSAPAPAPAPVPVPAPAPVPAPVLMPVPVLVPAGLDLEPSAAAAPVATLYSAHSSPPSSSPSSASSSAQQCPAQCPPRIRTWTLLAQGKLVAALASGREAGTAQQRAAAASAAAGLTLPPAMP